MSLATNALAGDQYAAAESAATFADKNVGSAKTVNVSGISISGTDAGNYALQNTTATTSASITPATLTVTANNATRVYGAPIPPSPTRSPASSMVRMLVWSAAQRL